MIRNLKMLILKIAFSPLWLLMLIVFLVSCLYKEAFNKDLSMLDDIKLYRLMEYWRL